MPVVYRLGGYQGDLDSYRTESCLNWLFYVEDVTSSDAYVVPEKDVREYMKRYTNDFPDEWKVEQKYATPSISNSFERGTPRAVDIFSMLSTVAFFSPRSI